MRPVLLIVLAINFCCNNRKETDLQNQFESYPQPFDSLSRQEQLLIQENCKIFNLPDLSSGVKNSVEIRVWPMDAFYFWKQVFVFKVDTTGWHGYHYFSYTVPIIDQEGKTMIFSDSKKAGDSVFLVKEIVPGCGWR